MEITVRSAFFCDWDVVNERAIKDGDWFKITWPNGFTSIDRVWILGGCAYVWYQLRGLQVKVFLRDSGCLLELKIPLT